MGAETLRMGVPRAPCAGAAGWWVRSRSGSKAAFQGHAGSNDVGASVEFVFLGSRGRKQCHSWYSNKLGSSRQEVTSTRAPQHCGCCRLAHRRPLATPRTPTPSRPGGLLSWSWCQQPASALQLPGAACRHTRQFAVAPKRRHACPCCCRACAGSARGIQTLCSS